MRDIADGDCQSSKFRRYPVNVDFKRTKKTLLFDVTYDNANNFRIVFQNFSCLFDGVAPLLNLALVTGRKRSTDVR